ncbi:NAD(P)-binding protein [Rhizoclosmatium globosum]|uniref:NAD(P)-binding protein n=1 Tax=Rhizoclosmatium globosum TaxID=329046 RepID=A0A1Y2BSE1_9FUNG|nr:NAD(P)-binding protein [Rhizoclosmatium globosum]|eukprot:ORY37671.1 NAD(P)-binding protein [Rhizoclosmatium globosum]
MSSNKVYVVTGGNSGIGLGTALKLAETKTNTVIIAARSPDKNASAVTKIKNETGNQNIHSFQLNLTSLSAVKTFSETLLTQFPRIDGLVCNAGLLTKQYSLSPEGYESTIATNHLGHFLLIQLLLPSLQSVGTPESPSRLAIVSSFTINPKNMSSMPYPNLVSDFTDALKAESNTAFNGEQAYTNSKLLNAVTGKYLASIVGKNVVVSVYDPGYVVTDIVRETKGVAGFMVKSVLPSVLKPFWKKVSTVERSGGFLASLATGHGENGKYYSVDGEEAWAEKVLDVEFGKKVYTQSLELVKPFV